jgi:high-affinity Fe2+/Pb2+ permease
MKQTKKQSIIESITQTVIGLVTSFLIQLIIYPILNIPVTFSQNLIITFVFFLASILRGYVIRRFFNNKLKCDEKI